MATSAWDSGKIFYTQYFKTKNNKKTFLNYFSRIAVASIIGGMFLGYTLLKTNTSLFISLLAFIWFVFERIFDERQRFLVAIQKFSTWSNIVLVKTFCIFFCTITLLPFGINNKAALVSGIFIAGNCLPLFLFEKAKINTILNVFKAENLKYGIKSIFLNWLSITAGLASASQTLPKYLVNLFSTGNKITEVYLIFSICSIQSLYIFSFYLVRQRWKIFRSVATNSIYTKDFYLHILGIFFICLVSLIIFTGLKVLTIYNAFFLFLVIFTTELFTNLNSVSRDVLFYAGKNKIVLKNDVIYLITFLITYGVILHKNYNIYWALNLLLVSELIRFFFYRYQQSQ